MPIFNVQSPSGRSFSVDAATEEHATDYVTRRFFSGFEAAGNSVDEPDARLLGSFGPPPKQEQQQRPSWQEFVDTLDPPTSAAEEPTPPSPFDQPNLLSKIPWRNRAAPAGALQRLARLRAGFQARASASARSTPSPSFLLRLKGDR